MIILSTRFNLVKLLCFSLTGIISRISCKIVLKPRGFQKIECHTFFIKSQIIKNSQLKKFLIFYIPI